MRRTREHVALLIAPWLYEGHERAARWMGYATKWTAERDSLADAIEEYMLWQPGKAGHAAAHRALVAALRKVRP